MSKTVYFSPMAYSRYEASQTLPAKFDNMLKASGLSGRLKGKQVAIKMHVGDGITYSTIPPVFIRKLVDFIKASGGDCFITDHNVERRQPENRGYTSSILGCPVLDSCGYFGKYYYTKEADYKKLRHIDVAGLIHDADFLIDFSHVKGHGACAFGGACKNIAMGCVTDRTRQELHSLEGGISWNEEKCIHCGKCIKACNHYANSFSEPDYKGKYKVFFHNCTLCQHCVLVCPTKALLLESHDYHDFQTGMAIVTKSVLEEFEPANVFFINMLISITALCDCWGMTTPSLVPDIGIVAGNNIVKVETATLDLIKTENLNLEGIPQDYKLTGRGHLFEQIHGKNPYDQISALEQIGMGTNEYTLEIIN
ncbi:MAG: DUF362 domain-containing protein [Eubacteriales bacterium]|nr:DUF362 domain-containing protein [Eubacteriales bacterium]